MRLYSITNMYLSSIQNGIQTAHAIHEMFLKYSEESEQREQLIEWATDHKTIIVLNGGPSEKMLELLEIVQQMHIFPWSLFREPSLENALTSISIIVPTSYYDDTFDVFRNIETKDFLLNYFVEEYANEINMLNKIMHMPLAK